MELAFEARIDKSYVVNVENGKANLTVKKVARIADALDQDISVLFEWPGRRQKSTIN